jgi:rare lipoprotein A
MALSLSACALDNYGQAPAPALKAEKQPPLARAAGKGSDIIPPEPPLPVERTPLGLRNRTHKPYQMNGKTYYPLVTAGGYEERGVACWYGPSFHGRKTSSGEVFDMYGVSAAHKILPMHTNVEVTNLENGKSIRLKINDRGPFVSGRVLDLSYGAAKSLAIIDKGLARVLIRTCGPVEGHRKNDMVGDFFVHVGAFEQKADALCLLDDMKALKYKRQFLKVIKAERDGSVLWRVELGPYKSMASADKVHTKVIQEYPSAFVVAK